MGELLSVPGGTVFAAALVVMVLVGAVEAIGLGGSAIGVNLDVDADGHALGWLGVGQVPLLVLLVVFLAVFGLGGLAVQQAADGLTGGYLPAWAAIAGTAIVALPITGALARMIAPILPRDETTAIQVDDLVGRPAVIVTGQATIGSPARARAVDVHGQAHFVMVEPNADSERFGEGDTVLLVRREAHVFRAIGRGDEALRLGI